MSDSCQRAGRLAILVAVSLAACVPRDAGYRSATARVGYDVHWRRIDGEGAAAKRTRELLSQPLTAESAVQIALLNNQRLQAVFEELGAARGRLVSALALPNPELEAALKFHLERDESPDLEFGAMTSLSRLFLLPLRNSAESAALDAARLGVAGAALDVVLEARTAYYRHQAAEQIVELRKTVLDATRASYEAAKRLHAAGNVTDLQLANEQALYEDSRLLASQAEESLAVARQRLNAVMGLWGTSAAWRSAGRLPEPESRTPDLESLERRALEASLDLAIAKRRFASAASTKNVAAFESFVPELRGGVAAEREEGDWRLGPKVSLELPLFYQGQGRVASAESEMERQKRLHADIAINVRAQAQASAQRLRTLGERAGFYKSVLLPLRQRVVDQTQLEFNAMAVGVFQLLQAKRDQIETARAYVETVRDYWIARAEVEQLRAGRMLKPETSAERVDAGPAAGSADFAH